MKDFFKYILMTGVFMAIQNAVATVQPEGVCTTKFVVDGTSYTQQITVLTGEDNGIISVKQLKPRTPSIAMYQMQANGDLKILKKGPRQLRWSSYRYNGKKLLLKLEDDLVSKCEFKN
jgi:hypothetical protein